MKDQQDFQSVMDQLNQAKRAVERAQEERSGFTEAQQQVKQAEEMLNEATHNPALFRGIGNHDMQRATDLLRLIEETNQANNR
ncbi:hypothetical protein SAMN05421743_10997 [Thalassobacillus cyri]|uniref:Uncharacterized protein n=1 Tax=Thalassobacillus cyri TaxID=571932 RepID=A0A1H4EIY5_9BACI|nr:hypothetical protein [Thalassobacillus cyri]SEA84995.1 hypothetical protein SAMN05421743_10997 [Thalassobacillus cyri]